LRIVGALSVLTMAEQNHRIKQPPINPCDVVYKKYFDIYIEFVSLKKNEFSILEIAIEELKKNIVFF